MKKTRVYGMVAVLSAMILVGLIFVFGSAPGLSPNPPITTDSDNGGTGTPSTSPNPGTHTSPNTNPNSNPDANPSVNPTDISAESVSPMKRFQSLDELKTYLNSNSATNNVFGGGPLDSKALESSRGLAQGVIPLIPSDTSSPTYSVGTGGDDYSTTNIQVAGVDEADTTKNDGQFIYTQSSDYSTGRSYVYIVKADPGDPRVVSRIALDNNTYLAGMFLSQDSSKLIIIGSQYRYYILDSKVATEVPASGIAIAPYYYSDVQTFLNIYNIVDKTHPTLESNFTLSGSYFNSRMIGDYVYAIVSQSAFVYNDLVVLPRVATATSSAEISANQIYYAEEANFTEAPHNYFTFTSFYSLNLKDPSQFTNMTVLMGGASTMYVSLGNMYITYPTWTYDMGSFTSVYRVSIDNGKLAFQAKGGVPGNVLNQYSMDEYKGYFRLATTSWEDTTQNSIYVMNMDLNTVGSLQLQNAEVRETIQSARFIGDKAYIVTFQQKDPFFVLDMSEPAAPKMAGKLEIPGFSSYLHPYDENHIIGLGMENSSVKLSLFDVTNVNSPTEVAKYIVKGDYSYSEAQYDPKAFLFDLSRQLLVIPVQVTTYGVVSGGTAPPTSPSDRATTIAQVGYWQGAYVFKLTVTEGFQLQGGITHQGSASTSTYYYGDYNLNINRALYIGNTLYTVSNAKLKLNSLTDLAPIADVNLK